jgi:uncharacterized protein with HEPN domain
MKRLVCCLLLSISGAAGSAGTNFTATDYRIPIEVTAKERNQILYEMREFLHGMHNIHHALSRNDVKAVGLEARTMGETMNRLPNTVRDRLPEGFMQMSIAMQEAYIALGKQTDPQAIQGQMAEIMTYCSGCHDTYRFELVAYKAGKRPVVDKVNPYIPK